MTTNEEKKGGWASLFEAMLANPRSWMPLVQAYSEEIEWMLDVAEARAIEINAPVEWVRHVRGYLSARFGGFPVHWSLIDHDALMSTAALFLQAMERDLGPVTGRSTSFHNAADTRDLFRLHFGALFDGKKHSREPAAQKDNAS